MVVVCKVIIQISISIENNELFFLSNAQSYELRKKSVQRKNSFRIEPLNKNKTKIENFKILLFSSKNKQFKLM